MVALENHHYFATPRQRRKAAYRAERVWRHRHDGRAATWQLTIAGLLLFWGAVAYAVHAL